MTCDLSSSSKIQLVPLEPFLLLRLAQKSMRFLLALPPRLDREVRGQDVIP